VPWLTVAPQAMRECTLKQHVGTVFLLLQDIEDMLQAAAHDPDVGPPSGFSSASSLETPAAPSGYSSDEEAGRGLAEELSGSDDEYPEGRDDGDDSYSD
jgi:hypothetical protein